MYFKIYWIVASWTTFMYGYTKYRFSSLAPIYVTGSAKTGLISHDIKVQFFATNTKTHQCTIKFHCQNEVALSGLLLLAAFSQPIGNPYAWSGS